MAAASSLATVISPSRWMLGGRVLGSMIMFRIWTRMVTRSVSGQLREALVAVAKDRPFFH
jgi:hypothetical protein